MSALSEVYDELRNQQERCSRLSGLIGGLEYLAKKALEPNVSEQQLFHLRESFVEYQNRIAMEFDI